jgi:hypothetical protein
VSLARIKYVVVGVIALVSAIATPLALLSWIVRFDWAPLMVLALMVFWGSSIFLIAALRVRP